VTELHLDAPLTTVLKNQVMLPHSFRAIVCSYLSTVLLIGKFSRLGARKSHNSIFMATNTNATYQPCYFGSHVTIYGSLGNSSSTKNTKVGSTTKINTIPHIAEIRPNFSHLLY